MFRETISLVLKHADISTDATLDSVYNSVGSWSNGKQKTTWNINLRSLMGDKMCDENDIFCLRLNQLCHAYANFPATARVDEQLEFNISGLNFVNSTYDVRTGNNTGRYKALITNISLNATATYSFPPNVSLCNFTKSGDNIRLTIELLRVSDGEAAQYGTEKFPHMAYSFDIFPVLKK